MGYQGGSLLGLAALLVVNLSPGLRAVAGLLAAGVDFP